MTSTPFPVASFSGEGAEEAEGVGGESGDCGEGGRNSGKGVEGT